MHSYSRMIKSSLFSLFKRNTTKNTDDIQNASSAIAVFSRFTQQEPQPEFPIQLLLLQHSDDPLQRGKDLIAQCQRAARRKEERHLDELSEPLLQLHSPTARRAKRSALQHRFPKHPEHDKDWSVAVVSVGSDFSKKNCARLKKRNKASLSKTSLSNDYTIILNV
ncbi:hypothetical protein F2P81_018806 [Scophthalmus maximus]|uniref:Uncharacterized protein n=1 Tax=Scophthalmus maximus TaxID=52904 RepID=A0A6A4SEX4_SCOMX|nr:hypothetical protein F2P81_018806 [Scophthalmus maximus]